MNAVQQRAMACADTTSSSHACASPLLPTHWPRYRPVRVIGCGSFGTVYLCKDAQSDALVAVKAIPLADLSDEEVCLAMNEVSILRQLQHPHIVRYLDTFMDDQSQQLCLVTEYVDGGDVGALIRKYSQEQDKKNKEKEDKTRLGSSNERPDTGACSTILQPCDGTDKDITGCHHSSALPHLNDDEYGTLHFTQGSEAVSEGATWYSSASFQPCQSAAAASCAATHMRLSSATRPDTYCDREDSAAFHSSSRHQHGDGNTLPIEKDNEDDEEDVLQAQEGYWLASFAITDIVRQCLEALHYLHALSILHRDIKPSNVYLTQDGIVKLGDFGVSKLLSPSEPFAHTFIGTPFYLSPELCLGEAYSFAADIWALGVLTYEMYCLQLPFAARNVLAQIHIITEGNYDRRRLNMAHRFASEQLDELRHLHGVDFERNEALLHSLVIDLVEQMLTMDPLRRPSASQLLAQCYGVTNVDRLSAPPTAYGPRITSSPPMPSTQEGKEVAVVRTSAMQANTSHDSTINTNNAKPMEDKLRVSSSHVRLASRIERSFDDLCSCLPHSRRASIAIAEAQARVASHKSSTGERPASRIFRSRLDRRSAPNTSNTQESKTAGGVGVHDVNVLTLDTMTEQPMHNSFTDDNAVNDELDVAIHSYTRHAITEMIEQVPWLRNAEAFSALALHAGSDDVVLVEHDGMDLVSFYSALSPTHRVATPRNTATNIAKDKQDTASKNELQNEAESESRRRAFARAIASLDTTPMRARRRVSLVRRPQSQRTRPHSSSIHIPPLASTIATAPLRGWTTRKDSNREENVIQQMNEKESELQPRLSRHGSDSVTTQLRLQKEHRTSSETDVSQKIEAKVHKALHLASSATRLTSARMSNASLVLQPSHEDKTDDRMRTDVKNCCNDEVVTKTDEWGTATLERLIRAKILAHHTQRYSKLHAQRQAKAHRAALHTALRQQLQSLYTNTYQATLRPSQAHTSTNTTTSVSDTCESNAAEKEQSVSKVDGEGSAEHTMRSVRTLADTQPPLSASTNHVNSKELLTVGDAAAGQPGVLLEAAVRSVLQERSARQHMTRSLHNSSARALSSAAMTLRSSSQPYYDDEDEGSEEENMKVDTARSNRPIVQETPKEQTLNHHTSSKVDDTYKSSARSHEQYATSIMCGHEVPSVETLAAQQLAQAARDAAARMRYRHRFTAQPPTRVELSPAVRPVRYDAVECDLWESSSVEETNETQRGCVRDKPRLVRKEARCRWSATPSTCFSSSLTEEEESEEEEEEEGEQADSSSSTEEFTEEEVIEDGEATTTSNMCSESDTTSVAVMSTTSASSASISTSITEQEEEEEEEVEEEEEGVYTALYDAKDGSRYFDYNLPLTLVLVNALPQKLHAVQSHSSHVHEEAKKEEESKTGVIAHDDIVTAKPLTVAPLTSQVAQPAVKLPLHTPTPVNTEQVDAAQPLCIVGQGLQAVTSRAVVNTPPTVTQDTAAVTTTNATASIRKTSSNSESDEDVVMSLTSSATTPSLPITLALRPLHDRTRLSGVAWRVRHALQHATLPADITARLYGECASHESLRLAQMQLYFCEPRQIIPRHKSSAQHRQGTQEAAQDTPVSIEGAVIALRTEEDWKEVRRVWAARYARRAFMRLYFVLPQQA